MKCHAAIRSLTLSLALCAPAWPQAAQPALVADIQPGAAGSQPGGLAPLLQKVVFSADDGLNGREPWVSDGTAAGTSMLADLDPLGSSSPSSFFGYANQVYFVAGSELWKTDGTPGGTLLLKDFVVASPGVVFLEGVGSGVFFAANDGIAGLELWRTDGTPAGTALVKDIHPGPASSIPSSVGSYIGAALGSKLFFSADDGVHGIELWESDGTLAGTQLLADLYPGSIGSLPYFLTAFSGRLWCRAFMQNLGGKELVAVDVVPGPSYGVVSVLLMNPGGDANPSGLTQWGSRVYFAADDGTTGREPWSIDGAFSFTSLGDLEPGAGDSMDAFPIFQAVGGRLYFTATTALHGREPWSSDGSAGGTSLLRDLQAGPGGSSPNGYANVDGEVLFAATASGDRELWRSDGTGAGTLPFWQIHPTGSADVGAPVRAGAHTFVAATDGASGKELFAFSSALSGTSYCTAGTSELGCKASIAASGVASRLEALGFQVSTTKAPGQKDGIFFFSTNGRQASPWGTGSSYQCVTPPVRRTPLSFSGGTATKCNGSHALDFNAWMAANPTKAPATGDAVQMQCWYRDPGNTSNQTTSLSNAIEFTVYP